MLCWHAVHFWLDLYIRSTLPARNACGASRSQASIEAAVLPPCSVPAAWCCRSLEGHHSGSQGDRALWGGCSGKQWQQAHQRCTRDGVWCCTAPQCGELLLLTVSVQQRHEYWLLQCCLADVCSFLFKLAAALCLSADSVSYTLRTPAAPRQALLKQMTGSGLSACGTLALLWQVTCYHISTMTISERSALARGWLADSRGPGMQEEADEPAGNDTSDSDSDGSSSSDIDESPPDLQETCGCCGSCGGLGAAQPAGARHAELHA